MPFPMRIQPIDSNRNNAVKPSVFKSRLMRLFDRQFGGVLKLTPAAENDGFAVALSEYEPSTMSLDKMVLNFYEGSSERQSSAARRRCNCFNGNSNDSSGDGNLSAPANPSFANLSDALKSLIPCESSTEKKLWAHASKIIKQHIKAVKTQELNKIVVDGLAALSYDSAICESKWEKTRSIPAGIYQYIDVVVQGERLIIDVNFRSQFCIADPTTGYKAVLKRLPRIFVGKSDRLRQIVTVAAKAVRLSMRKAGMYLPPWRKLEYSKSKWLSSHTRIKRQPEEEAGSPAEWQLPPLRPKVSTRRNKAVVAGLSSLFQEKL